MFNLSLLKKKNRNPRKIAPEQLEKLKKSLSEFQKMLPLRPIVYDPITLEILGGNQRFEALLQLGFKSVPNEWVKSAGDFTEDEKARFVVADNLGFGEWDTDILKEDFDLSALEEWGFDVSLLENSQVDFSAKNKEIDTSNFDENVTMKLSFSVEQFSFVQNKLGANPEIAILKLLKYES